MQDMLQEVLRAGNTNEEIIPTQRLNLRRRSSSAVTGRYSPTPLSRFIADVEEEWREQTGRPMTVIELERVL